MSAGDTLLVHPYSFPNGHLNHLTAEQETDFKQFKVLLEEREVYNPDIGNGVPSIDDVTLLSVLFCTVADRLRRFLRARKFKIQPAYEQLTKMQEWRKENDVDKLFMDVDIDAFEKTRKLYPQWTGRMDNRGMPLFVSELGPLDLKAISETEPSSKRPSAFRAYTFPSKLPTPTTTGPPPKMLLLYTLYECLCQFMTPWVTSTPNRAHFPTPITQDSNIMDVSGVGMKQFWDLKNHLQECSEMATGYYPETLEMIFIIGAPPFFPTAWSWIKKWFDPVVVSKMHLLAPADVFSTLSKYIEPSSIPKKYGGTLDYTYGDMPNLDPNLLEGFTWAEGVSELPIGPIKWEEDEEGKMRMIAVGSQAGVKRRLVLGRLDRSYRETFYPKQTVEGA